ncbi:MAG: chromosome segregation protein SMC [Clostridiales bacterium]|nr:chromosome segregation protein SMC [Clostridiales bacterium]
MYLKSIEVQGFKSFANKIVFEFHNGITGIVGPNGSGKSNVGDAVRWVLGEQSAKQLRGGNMQDVIFSGTETRKPLGFASVAITLDNSDHKLDIEYEEVTVTRRLYRSGESEYLLNGTACRLKDINELFYDTGIGKEGYSIIGQGQIDKILSGKPEERRELFDEAAGIVKFKRRKNTALKKLEEEQNNLVRVTDILSELTRQLGPLERQSETARIYLKKKEELKILDVNMFLVESQHIREELKAVEEKYQRAQEELNETQTVFEKTKAEYEEVEKSLEALDERIQQSREEASQNALRKQQLENDIQILQEQIRAAKLSDHHFQERIAAIRQELDRREEDGKKYLEEKEQMETSLKEISEKRNQAQERLNILHGEMEECSRAIENGKNEIIEILNQRASTKGKMQRYDAMLEQIGIRKAALSQRILKLKSDESEQVEIIKAHQGKYQEISGSMDVLTQEYQKTQREVTSIRKQLDDQNKRMEIGQTAYHRESSRLESLRNITERYEGYGNSIRRVMEQKERQPGIHGVVADLIKVPKKYEVAVETALGGSIQNIVTDNDQTAKYMIEFLKRNRYGRATFLPLTNMRRSSFANTAALKEEGVIGIADTLVETEETYRQLLSQILGRTLVVDTIDHAIGIGKKYNHSLRIVTLEGESLSPGGSMTGGAFKNSSNLLGRRREIDELEESVEALRKDMEKMQAAIGKNREDRNRLRDHLTELTEQLQKLQLSQNTERMNIRQAETRIREIQGGYGQLKSEGREIESQIQEIKTSSLTIKEELEESAAREKEQETLVNEHQKILEEKQRLEGEYTQALNEIQLEYAAQEQKQSFARENISRIRQEEQSLKEEMVHLTASMDEGSREMEQKEENIQKIQETIEAAEKLQQDDDEKMKRYLAEKEEMNGRHKTFFQRRDEISGHISLMDKECFRLNSQKEKLEERQEGQINYLWEEYEITPSQAGSYRMEEIPDRAVIRKDIAELKDSIRKLGNVNVNAIEEYKELAERHEFLNNQHTDLVEAAETLKGIIGELDEGMRKQFAEKFEQIRTEFDKVFKQLFGGGKGTLELMEDEDILEAGIRIISQPPGKKLQNMMQLSGGEKALTAIALLFAIQNLKPSPFCLLDEIEAALDDSNVTRFAQYLHKLTKNTQFIIITHRRGTMNAADRLYGITMQEKGVSTLVSVNLIENQLDE